MNQAYIYDAVRTPRAKGSGKRTGALADLTPFELLEKLYAALEQRNDLDKNSVEDVVLGCVTQASEQAGNIAKASLMYAGWPEQIPGITVNRYCSSGLDALNIAAMKINVGQAHCTLAGGVEMMSRVPMMSDEAAVFSNPALATKCGMLMMGSGADLIASLYDVSREQADEIALQSHQRADRARSEGWFKSIIAIHNEQTGQLVEHDECIRPQTTLESLSELEPSFAKLGSMGVDSFQLAAARQLNEIRHIHTAGNSPALADAAALILVGDDSIKSAGHTPRAKIIATATICGDPLEVVSGCAAATENLLQEQGMSCDDVDLFELHEAFAATVIKCQRDLGIADDKLNVNGGVISLGHPMGATGAIMTLTLIDELERRQLKTGVVAASGAAGTGTAMLIELV